MTLFEDFSSDLGSCMVYCSFKCLAKDFMQPSDLAHDESNKDKFSNGQQSARHLASNIAVEPAKISTAQNELTLGSPIPFRRRLSNRPLNRLSSVLVVFLSTMFFAHAIGEDKNLVDFVPGTDGFSGGGITTGDKFGNSVAGIGDINNDGYDDVAFGAPEADGLGGSNCGKVMVVYGHAAATSFSQADLGTFAYGSKGFIFHGAVADEEIGRSIAAIGDFNGDAIADFIFGGGGDFYGGIAYVFFGRAASDPFPATIGLSTFTSGNAGFKVVGATFLEEVGKAVGGAGDVNGDNFDDLLIGAPYVDALTRQDCGAVYVLFGHAGPFVTITGGSAITGAVGFRIFGPVAGNYLGYSVSSAGDVNGDGYSDIVCGCPYADASNTRLSSGIVYVIFGHSGTFTDIDLLSFTSGALGFKILGAQARTALGYSVSGLGDVNADGYDDIILGAFNADRAEGGVTYVIFGGRGLPAAADVDLLTMVYGTLGFRIYGAAANDGLGRAVSGLGDVNGDGIPDMLVGAFMAGSPEFLECGALIIVFGHHNLTTFADIDTQSSFVPLGYRVFGPALGTQLGFSAGAAGDINRDGVNDIVAGAPMGSFGEEMMNGLAYVLFGSSQAPTRNPTAIPSRKPSMQPTSTPQPSEEPTYEPSLDPTMMPTLVPTTKPSHQPTFEPSLAPTMMPTLVPTTKPSHQPTLEPSLAPTMMPTLVPTTKPSHQPTLEPSLDPTMMPTLVPTTKPSHQPTFEPSLDPTMMPTLVPTTKPSHQPTPEPQPSEEPTFKPSMHPSRGPTMQPSWFPSSHPSAQPSDQPSTLPSSQPSLQPSSAPSALLASNATILTVTPFRNVVDLLVAVDGGMGAVVSCAAFEKRQSWTVSLLAIHAQGMEGGFVETGEQASVRVSGLLPYTNYDVYCSAVTLQGAEMSPAAVKDKRKTFRTACCKEFHVQLLATALVESTFSLSGLRIRSDATASEHLTLQIVFHSAAGTPSSTFPSAIVLSNSSSPGQSQDVAVVAGSVGVHMLQIVLSGPSAVEYNVSYEGSRLLTVLTSETEPATPQARAAKFTDDGSAVALSFDAPTDQGGYSNIFPCAKLLNFSGNAVATCQWTSSAIVMIYPVYTRNAPRRVLSVGSDISLHAGDIRAACGGRDTAVCKSWATVPVTQLQVVAPTAPILPVVSLLVPTTLGGCSPLVVDLTNSIGSAGRPWNTTRFKVLTAQGATPAAVQLENYLGANFTLNPPVAVPPTAFQKGFVYSIQATLCNFLGACATSAKPVTVLATTLGAPVVSILGPSRRSVYRASPLVLNSNAYTQTCSGAVSSTNLDFSWTVRQLLLNGTLTATALRSSSQSPAVLKLPAYTLDVSTQYEVTISVKSLASGLSSSSSVTVSVLQGQIVASITGGATKQLRVGGGIQLDASQSYDEDVPSKKGAAAGLTFVWTCVQIKPLFSTTCAVAATGLQMEKVSLQASATAVNTTSLFTVTVSDASRRSTAQVEVVVTGAVAPVIEITNTAASRTNINTGKRFVLSGSLLLFEPCTSTWSIEESAVSLAATAHTAVSRYFAPSGSKPSVFNLVLAENSLPARSTLLFSLACGSTSTSVSVTTNGAPLPGEFSVSPPAGDELITLFTFAATHWSDPDLPLTYQFGFQSAASLANLVTVSQSESPYAITKLTAGDEKNQYIVNCSLRIADSLGAVTAVLESATVRPLPPQAKEESLLNVLNAGTGSVDSTKNIISVVSSALNSANCSAVRNCSSLNRGPCLRTSGECGPCLSGYIGDAGDRSTQCIPTIETRGNSSATLCSSAQDCPLVWQVCDFAAAACVAPLKSCSQNCSQHGECAFVNRVTNKVQRVCRLDDFNCEAVCSCAQLYSGAFCEMGAEQQRKRRELRTTLLSSLSNLTALEDVEAKAVSAWSASLYAISSNPYELSVIDTEAIDAIVNATLYHAIALGMDAYEDVLGVLQATDTMAFLALNNDDPSSVVNNSAAAMVSTVTTFSDLVARSMVLGENATTLLYDNFRLSVHMDTLSSAAGNLSVSSPQSVGELLSGVVASSVQLAPAANASDTTAVALKMIAVYPRAYSPDTSAFVSSPLMLQVQSQGGDGDSIVPPEKYLSNVEFTFQHNEPQYQYLYSKVVSFTTVCTKRNETEQHSFVCPESGVVLSHNCSQGAGNQTSSCPKPAPGCAKLGVESSAITSVDSCFVVSYNLTYTTCSCPLSPSPQERHSRLHSTTEQQLLDDSGAVNMLASTVFIGTSFAATFSAADDFNSPSDASKVLVVIIMLGVLWVPALLFVCVDWMYTAERKSTKQSAVVDVEAQRSVITYIEHTIPEVYNAETSSWFRLRAELLKHHSVLRLLGRQSKQQRRLVIGNTVTVLTFLLFLAAVFFDISNPSNDGSCAGFTSETSCLKRTSPFDYDQTYCQWNTEPGTDEAPCSYKTQSMSMTALFYLTVLTTVLTAIATIPLDYLFGILSAPTAQSISSTKVSADPAAVLQMAGQSGTGGALQQDVAATDIARAPPQKRPSVLRSVSIRSLVDSAEDKVAASRDLPEEISQAGDAARASYALIERNSQAIMQRSGSTGCAPIVPSSAWCSETRFPAQTAVQGPTETAAALGLRASEETHEVSLSNAAMLCDEVIQLRKCMDDRVDHTAVFDAQWGVRANQPGADGKPYFIVAEALSAIEQDVISARAEAIKLRKVLHNCSVHHAGLEILHLFMVDLLGRNTPAAKIFQEKFGEEFGNTRVVTAVQKYAAAIILLGLNAFFAYFILLKAFQKGLEWQIQYLVCCIVQFAIELFLFETTECVWLNYSVPLFVHKEVAAAARKLIAHVDRLSAASEEQAGMYHNKSSSYSLNAPPYLFVSVQVASAFPKLLESLIVRSYSDHLPGEICRTWPHYMATLEGTLHAHTPPDEWTTSGEATLLPKSVIRGITLALQMFITVPYLYQRVLIRFLQPMIFSGISVVWFLAVQSVLSISIMSAIFGAGLLAILWCCYVRHKRAQQRRVAPAAETLPFMVASDRGLLPVAKEASLVTTCAAGNRTSVEQEIGGKVTDAPTEAADLVCKFSASLSDDGNVGSVSSDSADSTDSAPSVCRTGTVKVPVVSAAALESAPLAPTVLAENHDWVDYSDVSTPTEGSVNGD